MSAAEESKTADVTATDGGYPAAGEGHGHAAHGEAKGHGEGHAHGDGHDCGVDHGDGGHGDGHGHGGHGGHDDGGHGHGDDEDDDGEGGAGGMEGLEAMMGGMGGGEGGAGGMDMNALMAMMGKGGGKGGGGGMDMASMMGGMGGGMGGMGKGGGKGQAPPEDTDEKKGEKWVWMQKGEEVHIRFPLDPPATKKDISVTFKTNTLKVVIRGDTTLDGALGGKVDVDDCTWLLSPEKDELQVMLTKVVGKTDAWRDLLA